MSDKMNEPNNLPGKIAVIGPSQSGKTCLAVGLSVTNTRDFTIEYVDKDGRSYLEGLSLAFHSKKDDQGNRKPGAWPAATNLGTVKSIRFDFCKKGKTPIRVEFPEFSGELLGSDEKFTEFANAHFRNLDGVVLLINPGADAFQSGDGQLRADVMAQYKRVLSFLRDPNNGSDKALIALTVTASDRIRGDLKGKLDAFNESMEELSNTIRTSGFKCKRFCVTVTGHLNDQEEPTLAKGRRNLASEPFLWLLDELHWPPWIEAVMRKIGKGILAVVGLAALAGVWCGVSAWKTSSELDREKCGLEKSIDEARNPDPGDLKDINTRLVKLRSRTGFFAEKAKDIASDLDPKVFSAFYLLLNKELNTIIGSPEKYGNDKDCTRVDSLFAIWRPTNSETLEKYEELKKNWENRIKLECQDRYAIAKMLEDIQKPLETKVDLHGEDAFRLFYGLYGMLATINPTSPNAATNKESIASKLDARVEKEWRDYVLPNFDKAAAEQATAEKIDALQKRLNDWNPVTQSGKEAKERLLADVANCMPTWRERYEKTQADKLNEVNAKHRKEACDWVRQNVFPGRPRIGENGIWEAYERVVRERWAEENPFFDEIVRAAVYREAEKWLEEDVAAFRAELSPAAGTPIWEDAEHMAARIKNLDARFQEFCRTCRRIAKFKDHPHPENSWAYRFATFCIAKGKIDKGFYNAFPQRIVVPNLDVAIDYKGDFPTFYGGTAFAAWFEVYSFNPDGSLNNDATRFEYLIAPKDGHAPIDGETQNVLGKADENQWKNIWDKGKTFDVGLFQYCYFRVLATDYNNGWLNRYKYDGEIRCYLKLPSGNIDADLLGQLEIHRNTGASVVDIHAKLIARIEGDTPFSLLEEAKKEVQGNQ